MNALRSLLGWPVFQFKRAATSPQVVGLVGGLVIALLAASVIYTVWTIAGALAGGPARYAVFWGLLTLFVGWMV